MKRFTPAEILEAYKTLGISTERRPSSEKPSLDDVDNREIWVVREDSVTS